MAEQESTTKSSGNELLELLKRFEEMAGRQATLSDLKQIEEMTGDSGRNSKDLTINDGFKSIIEMLDKRKNSAEVSISKSVNNEADNPEDIIKRYNNLSGSDRVLYKSEMRSKGIDVDKLLKEQAAPTQSKQPQSTQQHINNQLVAPSIDLSYDGSFSDTSESAIDNTENYKPNTYNSGTHEVNPQEFNNLDLQQQPKLQGTAPEAEEQVKDIFNMFEDLNTSRVNEDIVPIFDTIPANVPETEEYANKNELEQSKYYYKEDDNPITQQMIDDQELMIVPRAGEISCQLEPSSEDQKGDNIYEADIITDCGNFDTPTMREQFINELTEGLRRTLQSQVKMELQEEQSSNLQFDNTPSTQEQYSQSQYSQQYNQSVNNTQPAYNQSVNNIQPTYSQPTDIFGDMTTATVMEYRDPLQEHDNYIRDLQMKMTQQAASGFVDPAILQELQEAMKKREVLAREDEELRMQGKAHTPLQSKSTTSEDADGKQIKEIEQKKI